MSASHTLIWSAILALLGCMVSVLLRLRKRRHSKLFQKTAFADSSTGFEAVREMHSRFNIRREGDFTDRWAEDLSDRRKSSGLTAAVATGFWDVLTVGGAARKRARAKEREAVGRLSQAIDGTMLSASGNIRLAIAATAPRIDHAFGLLSESKKITDPLHATDGGFDVPSISQPKTSLGANIDRLRAGQSEFLDIAVAAGAGTATAIGLWGAVQVAGYASTHAAMAGLYGAAATNAGWAWFGGGSLATGGGGMALGHVVLPGVGVGVAWSVLTLRLHRAANELEKQIKVIEEWSNQNMPVLSSLIQVEQNYRIGTEKFRLALQSLDDQFKWTNRKLRPFGIFSDWKRKRRTVNGDDYYTLAESQLVERLAETVEHFLDQLPASRPD